MGTKKVAGTNAPKRVRSSSTTDTVSTADTSNLDYAAVARRAYEHYLARGGADGNDLEDWLTAERELVRHDVS